MDGEVKGKPTMIRMDRPTVGHTAGSPSYDPKIEAAIMRLERAVIANTRAFADIKIEVPPQPAPIVHVNVPEMPVPVVHIARQDIPPPVVHVEVAAPELRPEFKIPDYKWQPNVIIPDPKIIEIQPILNINLPQPIIGILSIGMTGMFLVSLAALIHFW